MQQKQVCDLCLLAQTGVRCMPCRCGEKLAKESTGLWLYGSWEPEESGTGISPRQVTKQREEISILPGVGRD